MIYSNQVLRLFNQFDPSGNLFYSPVSIKQAMLLAAIGSRHETNDQILASISETRHTSDKALLDILMGLDNLLRNIPGVELSNANKLYASHQFQFVQDYLKLINQAGVIERIDFSDPARAIQLINSWVSEHTNHLIPHLLGDGSLDPHVKAVLVNAIHLLAPWKTPFDPDETKVDSFYTPSGAVQTPFMHAKQDLLYAKGNGYQITSLPYNGDALHMVLVLPDEGQSLHNLMLGELSGMGLTDAINSLRHTPDVSLSLPKWEFTWGTNDITPALEQLGIRIPFTRAANFSGMDPANSIYISSVFHQAYVNVDEQGTEAAAATAIVFRSKGISMSTSINLNRPFAFFITGRDGTAPVIFAGRVEDPTKK